MDSKENITINQFIKIFAWLFTINFLPPNKSEDLSNIFYLDDKISHIYLELRNYYRLKQFEKSKQISYDEDVKSITFQDISINYLNKIMLCEQTLNSNVSESLKKKM